MSYCRSTLLVGVSLGFVFSLAFAQASHDAASNAQLASPEIEQKVNTLLKRMTFDEKIGQLVQYSATEAHPAKLSGPSTAALNVNPPGPRGIDTYALAQKGELGSMLNTVGQSLTNHFQHAAVDNTRLHIPLLFGADVIHGFRTIFPVPLATASSWDPALVTDLAHMAAVEAGAATVMSSFNSLNGVPASANPFLLQTILRDEWGFDGLVVSDYTAVMELTHHGIALDPAMATEKAITAGVDIDMMSHYYDAELPALVEAGRVPMTVVDEAVRRILRVKFALGLFDHPFADGAEVTGAVAGHRPLVRRAAEESFVLLQNKPAPEEPLLPLAKTTKRIALIGPLADDASDMVGAWSGANNFSDVRTLLATMAERAEQSGATFTYAKGTEISGMSNSGFAAAVAAAQNSDVAILALGESSDMTGEAASRAFLDLPGNQQQLLEAVVASGKPVVLLVFSGRPLVLDWAAQHVSAIMEVWYPGVEAGPAIADTLFGDVAPSGKLTMSFPRAVGQEPLYYNQLPTGRPIQHADPAHPGFVEMKFVSRYLDVPNDALFPFGHGLSYSTFGYSSISLSTQSISSSSLMRDQKSQPIVATAAVTNTGKRSATEIVQCYINIRGASTEQPVRNLKGFTRITLDPGQTQTVQFPLGFNELSFYNAKAQQVVEPADYTVYIDGSSTATNAAHFATTP